MATLVIDDKRIPFPNTKMSRYVMDIIDDDDTDVLILVGTPEETVNAVESFGVLRELDEALDAFNQPKEGDTVETMKGVKERITDLYSRFKHLIDGNRVYDLLYPVNEVVKKVVDYEKGTSLAGWFSDKELPMDINVAFREACKEGHESIARWLHSLGADIHADDDDAFLLACRQGHESIARWLHSIGADIHACDDRAFRLACQYGHESIARWLLSLGFDIHACDELVFRSACRNGQERIARWLYSLGKVDIHARDDRAFRSSCENGHESIARWLYSLGGVNIHACDNYAFFLACVYGHKSIIEWLKELGCGQMNPRSTAHRKNK